MSDEQPRFQYPINIVHHSRESQDGEPFRYSSIGDDEKVIAEVTLTKDVPWCIVWSGGDLTTYSNEAYALTWQELFEGFYGE